MACAAVQLLILILMLQMFGPSVRGILSAMLSPKSILPQCHHCHSTIHALTTLDHFTVPHHHLHCVPFPFTVIFYHPTFIYYLDPSTL